MKSISEKLGMPPEGGLPSVAPDPNVCEDTLTLRLETPMMGGGVQAGDVDWERPIRASSIRGHLRSWWRLFCVPGLTGNNLRTRESAIFGDTTQPSKLVVEVTCAPYHEKRRQNDNHGFANFGPEAYALFPARGEHDIAKEGLTFTLTLRYPETTTLKDGTLLLIKDDIRKALAGWIYFGGIGARTRRGLGTLSCVEAKLGGGGALPNLQDLLNTNNNIRVYKKNAVSALGAWHDVLDAYKKYRQYRNPGTQPNRPGRSRWPEPDSIRQLTGRSDPRHIPAITAPLPSFPRTSLGLPIIFHFKDQRTGDPHDVQLKGIRNGAREVSERMASPVITKAIKDGNQWFSAIVILPHGEALHVTPAPDISPRVPIIGVQDARYATAPYDPMHGADNAITGFENYAQANGFTIVR